MQNFLQKPLLKMALWTLLSDKNLNNGWYLYIAYLQGAKGTSSIFPPNLFFFFLIHFRYRSKIISASLILSRTLTQAAGAGRLPSIVLGLEKWQPGESTWLGDVAGGRGRVAWLLRPLVFSPGRIEAVTLLPHRCYTWKRCI